MRYLARLTISRGRKVSLLGDAAALAASICPDPTARDALVLIDHITIGLNLVRSALEEPGKASQVSRERRPVARVILSQHVTHQRREHGGAQLKLSELARRGHGHQGRRSFVFLNRCTDASTGALFVFKRMWF